MGNIFFEKYFFASFEELSLSFFKALAWELFCVLHPIKNWRETSECASGRKQFCEEQLRE